MAIYKVKDPTGALREIQGPDGATDEQIIAQAKILFADNNHAQVEQKNPDTPEQVSQKLAKAKAELAGIDKMEIEPPNTFARRVVQGAASGPVMGGVQMLADATGNKELSDKIAKNTREGNIVGSLLNPEMLLTGGAAGKFIGQGANMAAKALRAGVVGAGYGGTSTIANPTDDKVSDRLSQGAISGATGAVLMPTMAGAVRGGQYLIDAIRGRTAKINAGKIARDVAGDKLDDIILANKNAPSDITSAQATEGVDRDVYQALGKMAERKDQNSFYRMLGDRQEVGRVNAMEAVKPDLNAAIKTRSAVADPMYSAVRESKQPVNTLQIADKVNKLLDENSGNPALVTELTKVKNALYDDAGNLLKDPKKISSIMDGLKNSMASKDNKFILGTLTDIRSDIAKALPGRVEADAKFAELSKPVNQATVIDAMVNTLKSPKGGERVTPFLNAMGTGENALIKRANQSPRFGGLDEILNAPQKSARDKVVNELLRDANVERKAVAGSGGLADILGGGSWRARLPAFVDAKFAAANKALDVIENRVNKNTMNAIIEGMKSGKNANEMLNTLPTGERLKVIQLIKQGKLAPYMNSAITSMQQQGDE